MPLIPIESIDDPRLNPYRGLRHQTTDKTSDSFIAEGWFVVERLLASDFGVRSILVGEQHLKRLQPLIADQHRVFVIEGKIPTQLVGYKFHAGVLAQGVRNQRSELSDLTLHAKKRSLVVVCPHTTDPDNLGSIIRLCVAFESDALILSDLCADPFSRRSLRLSMGSAFYLPIFWSSDMKSTLRALGHDAEYSLVAAVVGKEGGPLTAASRPDRLAILFGNEGSGLAQELVELCDSRLTIEMGTQIDSLNVATSAAIMLHYFRNQA